MGDAQDENGWAYLSGVTGVDMAGYFKLAFTLPKRLWTRRREAMNYAKPLWQKQRQA